MGNYTAMHRQKHFLGAAVMTQNTIIGGHQHGKNVCSLYKQRKNTETMLDTVEELIADLVRDTPITF